MSVKNFYIDIDYNGNSSLNTGMQTVSENTIITPQEISGNINDYAPDRIQEVSVLRISASDTFELSGIVAPTNLVWKKLIIINVGNRSITLVNNSNASLDGNRFLLENDANKLLTPNMIVELLYDGISRNWRGK